MSGRQFKVDEIPYFSYDRAMTTGAIQSALAEKGSDTWIRTASWLMREAAFPDVWFFLKPVDVAVQLERLSPFLGKRREFWQYIIGAWRELGKFEGTDAA